MTYNLKFNGNTAVADTRGAELISYRDDSGTEYIWNGDSAYWTGHNPLLFPIVGSLKNDEAQIEGGTYRMARHGFARRSDFEVAESGEHYIVFRLRDNAQTLAQYPYHFELLVRHELTSSGFTTKYTVNCTDNRPIQFCIGAHTGFMCPLHKNEKFEDYSLEFEKAEDLCSMMLTEDGLIDPEKATVLDKNARVLALDHKLFDDDALIFKGLRSQSVALRHNTTGKGVKMNYAGFPMLGIWSKPHSDAPYVCIEPWVGHSADANDNGEFSDKPYVITLPAGKSYSIDYTVEIL